MNQIDEKEKDSTAIIAFIYLLCILILDKIMRICKISL